MARLPWILCVTALLWVTCEGFAIPIGEGVESAGNASDTQEAALEQTSAPVSTEDATAGDHSPPVSAPVESTVTEGSTTQAIESSPPLETNASSDIGAVPSNTLEQEVSGPPDTAGKVTGEQPSDSLLREPSTETSTTSSNVEGVASTTSASVPTDVQEPATPRSDNQGLVADETSSSSALGDGADLKQAQDSDGEQLTTMVPPLEKPIGSPDAPSSIVDPRIAPLLIDLNPKITYLGEPDIAKVPTSPELPAAESLALPETSENSDDTEAGVSQLEPSSESAIIAPSAEASKPKNEDQGGLEGSDEKTPDEDLIPRSGSSAISASETSISSAAGEKSSVPATAGTPAITSSKDSQKLVETESTDGREKRIKEQMLVLTSPPPEAETTKMEQPGLPSPVTGKLAEALPLVSASHADLVTAGDKDTDSQLGASSPEKTIHAVAASAGPVETTVVEASQNEKSIGQGAKLQSSSSEEAVLPADTTTMEKQITQTTVVEEAEEPLPLIPSTAAVPIASDTDQSKQVKTILAQSEGEALLIKSQEPRVALTEDVPDSTAIEEPSILVNQQSSLPPVPQASEIVKSKPEMKPIGGELSEHEKSSSPKSTSVDQEDPPVGLLDATESALDRQHSADSAQKGFKKLQQRDAVNPTPAVLVLVESPLVPKGGLTFGGNSLSEPSSGEISISVVPPANIASFINELMRQAPEAAGETHPSWVAESSRSFGAAPDDASTLGGNLLESEGHSPEEIPPRNSAETGSFLEPVATGKSNINDEAPPDSNNGRAEATPAVDYESISADNTQEDNQHKSLQLRQEGPSISQIDVGVLSSLGTFTEEVLLSTLTPEVANASVDQQRVSAGTESQLERPPNPQDPPMTESTSIEEPRGLADQDQLRILHNGGDASGGENGAPMGLPDSTDERPAEEEQTAAPSSVSPPTPGNPLEPKHAIGDPSVTNEKLVKLQPQVAIVFLDEESPSGGIVKERDSRTIADNNVFPYDQIFFDHDQKKPGIFNFQATWAHPSIPLTLNEVILQALQDNKVVPDQIQSVTVILLRNVPLDKPYKAKTFVGTRNQGIFSFVIPWTDLGKSAEEFIESVVATVQMSGFNPEDVFRVLLTAWKQIPLERRFPYIKIVPCRNRKTPCSAALQKQTQKQKPYIRAMPLPQKDKYPSSPRPAQERQKPYVLRREPKEAGVSAIPAYVMQKRPLYQRPPEYSEPPQPLPPANYYKKPTPVAIRPSYNKPSLYPPGPSQIQDKRPGYTRDQPLPNTPQHYADINPVTKYGYHKDKTYFDRPAPQSVTIHGYRYEDEDDYGPEQPSYVPLSGLEVKEDAYDATNKYNEEDQAGYQSVDDVGYEGSQMGEDALYEDSNDDYNPVTKFGYYKKNTYFQRTEKPTANYGQVNQGTPGYRVYPSRVDYTGR